MNRLFIIVALLLAAASISAWNKGMPKGAKFFPEQSQEEVARQQSKQVVVGEVGAVQDREAKPSIDGPSSEGAAAQDLASASRAAEDVRKAGQQLREGKGGFPWWMAIFGLIGFACVLALRQYANRAIPEAPRIKRPKW